MLHKPWLVLPQAWHHGTGVQMAREQASLRVITNLKKVVFSDCWIWSIQYLGVLYHGGDHLQDKLSSANEDRIQQLVSECDRCSWQVCGIKTFASSVHRQRLKLLMTSVAWLLSLLNQWSQDKNKTMTQVVTQRVKEWAMSLESHGCTPTSVLPWNSPCDLGQCS